MNPCIAVPNGEILVSAVRGVLYGVHDLGMEFGKISYDSCAIQILPWQGEFLCAPLRSYQPVPVAWATVHIIANATLWRSDLQTESRPLHDVHDVHDVHP
jgi:hypothetical protein